MLARFCCGVVLLTTILPSTSAHAQITGPLNLPIGNGVGELGVERVPNEECRGCLLYTSPSPRDRQKSRMPSSA